MSLTKIGLDVSDYDSKDGDLTLAENDSQIRLRNLGLDYASGTAEITAWANFGSIKGWTYNNSNQLGPSSILGTGGSIAGGKYRTGGAELALLPLPNDYDHGFFTLVFLFTPTWNGVPVAFHRLFGAMPTMGINKANQLFAQILTGSGNLQIRLFNNDDTAVIIVADLSPETVNGALNSWKDDEPVYIAITVNRTDGTTSVYASRVSSGTATRHYHNTGVTKFAEDDGALSFSIGGYTLIRFSDILIHEVAIFNGPISTAGSFAIPEEIEEIFVQTQPKIVLNEIDAEGSRTWDMSTWKVNQLVTVGVEYEFAYSVSDTSGVHTLSAYMSEADIRSEPDPTGRYMLTAVSLDSDNGIERATIADTGDFITVGDATTAMPDTPTFSGLASGDAKFTVTLTPSAIFYDHTIILYRLWSPTKAASWSSQQYDGAAGTEADVDVSGLTNYKWYEVVLYDVSGTDAFSTPTVSRLIYVTDKSSPLSDRLIAVRDRISSSISEFSMVRITPELGFFGQQKGAYCVVTSGGGPRLFENAGWGPQTIRVGVFAELQSDIFTEETVIGNATTGDKGLNDFTDEIIALFDDYVPADNSPAFHFQASRVGGPQKIEAADPESWLRMQVIDITVQFEET